MEHWSKYWIYYILGGIVLLLCVVFVLCYLPNFQYYMPGENSDWGAFGNFFWGLGTMLLTGLNVFVFYKLTVLFEKSKEKRDKTIFRLQKEQIDNERRLALLKDMRNIIESTYSYKISNETRGQMFFVLNRIHVFHNLFPSVNIEEDIIPLKNGLRTIVGATPNSWLKRIVEGKEMEIPVNKQEIDMITNFAHLESKLWQDFDNLINTSEMP